MNTALWIVQWILAVLFLAHGVLYLVTLQELRKTMERMPFSLGFLRFVGVAEVLAALGLVLPGLTGILTWLTPLAAAGLVPIIGGLLVLVVTLTERYKVLTISPLSSQELLGCQHSGMP